MNTNKALLALPFAAFLIAGCGSSPAPDNMQSATPGQSSPMQQQRPKPAPEPLRPLVVPADTSLPVVLGQTLNSRVNNAGEEFAGTIASDIIVDGAVAIPKGADVSGVITKSKKQGAFKGEADLAIRLSSVRVGGKSYPLSTSTYAESVKGKGKRTAVVTGGGAAVGALIGGLAGGGKGAAIGAGVGAGGGLAASGATGGQNVTLPAESRVTFKLTEAVTIDR